MNVILIGFIVLLFLTFSYLLGRSKMRNVELIDQHFVNQFQIKELLGIVSYHGGFPPIPRPIPLKVGLTTDSLILYSLKGDSGTIPYPQIHKIEHFTILSKADLKHKSVVFWGPLAPMIFKDKYRYFTSIKYTDINNDENNLLMEFKDSGVSTEFSRRIRNSCDFLTQVKGN